MITRNLSDHDIRRLLAHVQAIQAILDPPAPTDPDLWEPRHTVQDFLRTHVTPDPDAAVPMRTLHAAYATWAHAHGCTLLPVRRFAKHLPYPRRKSNSTVYLDGIRFADTQQS